MHPLVSFIYFFVVIAFSMFFLHPVFLGISFLASLIYSIILNGKRAVRFNFGIVVPMMFFMVFINPFLNHRGSTILMYIGENPITMEAIIYGIMMSLMFASVIFWFSCYNKVMTSDKIVYLFGRILPNLSILISMIFRFIPMYRERLKLVINAQKGIGMSTESKGILNKIKQGGKVLSIMTTWSLDSAVDTADSMKSRGYGLAGRTSFSKYSMRKADIISLIVIILCSIGIIIGGLESQYFPNISFDVSVIVLAFWGVLCGLGIVGAGFHASPQ